jgi:hypothetical protein
MQYRLYGSQDIGQSHATVTTVTYPCPIAIFYGWVHVVATGKPTTGRGQIPSRGILLARGAESGDPATQRRGLETCRRVATEPKVPALQQANARRRLADDARGRQDRAKAQQVKARRRASRERYHNNFNAAE